MNPLETHLSDLYKVGNLGEHGAPLLLLWPLYLSLGLMKEG